MRNAASKCRMASGIRPGIPDNAIPRLTCASAELGSTLSTTMIERTDDNERTGLLQIYIPPIEAIQTVDISLTNHDAEMGRGTGAVMNVLLKSGTNQIHGSAYEFLQNR